MANDCLVKKLEGVVDNPSLERLNEIKIINRSVDDTTESSYFFVSCIPNTTVKVRTSDGLNHIKYNDVFYDKVIISSAILYLDKGNYSIFIGDVNNIKQLTFGLVTDNTLPSYHITNVDKITKYIPNLTQLMIACDGENSVDINNTGLINNEKLQIFQCRRNSIKGDITNLSIPQYLYSSPYFLRIATGTVYGNLNKLISETPTPIFSLNVNSSYVTTGDLSLLHDGAKVFDVNSGNFTWEHQRPSTAFICSLKNTNLGNHVDAMLKNQANCVSSPYSAYDKIINVRGTHDESDADAVAAIATIKAAGWTVMINGETM